MRPEVIVAQLCVPTVGSPVLVLRSNDPQSCMSPPPPAAETRQTNWRDHKVFFAHVSAWRTPKTQIDRPVVISMIREGEQCAHGSVIIIRSSIPIFCRVRSYSSGRSKVLHFSNTGTTCSNPARGMGVCPYIRVQENNCGGTIESCQRSFIFKINCESEHARRPWSNSLPSTAIVSRSPRSVAS
jgi:hypothetical protein